MAVLDERHVLVADGRLRRVARPKRKNVRHLEPRRATSADLARRLAAGESVSDRDVREAIFELQASEEAHD
jgi:large subunit ribosomal protein L14e